MASEESEGGPGRPRRRLFAALLVLAMLAAIAVLGLPLIAAPALRGALLDELSASLGGEASVEHLSIGPRGVLRLTGLAAHDETGREVLALESLTADVAVLALLLGRVEASVVGSGLEAHLFRRADGGWSLAPRETADTGDGGDGEPGAPAGGEDEPADVPRLAVRVVLEDTVLHLEGSGGTSVLRVPELRLDVPTLDELAQLHLSAELEGPEGPAGGLQVEAGLALAAGGAPGLRSTAGGGALHLERLDLVGLAPLLEELAPLEAPVGILHGDVLVQLKPDLALEADLMLNGERLGAARVGERGPVTLPPLEVLGHASPGEEGGSTIDLVVRARSALEISWRGTLAEDLAVSGKLDFTAGLGQLADLLEATPLPGELAGRVHGALDLERDAAGLSVTGRVAPERLRVSGTPVFADPITVTAFVPADPEAPRTLELEATALGARPPGGAPWELDAGRAAVALAGDRLIVDTGFEGFGGALALTGSLPLEGRADAAPAEVRLGLDDVAANAALSDLLALFHPALAGVRQLQGELGGRVTCELELAYDAPFDTELLAGGWDALPKEPIRGRGRLAIDGAFLSGTELVDRIAGALGEDGALGLRPIEVTIDGGRLRYDEPWSWTIADVEATFAGSVGLDRTLDLELAVPVSDELVRRRSFLEPLRGETLRVPVRGTVNSPQVDLEGALSRAGATAIERELGGLLERELGVRVDELLGGGDSIENPADLLERADSLWDEGLRDEAGRLYRRIREEHRVTLLYALNKDRIKARMSHGE
jgi:hypothetical protein